MESHIPVKKEPELADGKAAGVSKVAPTPTPKRAKTMDFGLASMWEDCKVVRDLLRDHKRLIRWMSEKQVNVITLETLGLNAVVMGKVAEYHCPKTNKVKAPGIDFLKAQVGGVLKPKKIARMLPFLLFDGFGFLGLAILGNVLNNQFVPLINYSSALLGMEAPNSSGNPFGSCCNSP